MPDEQEDGMKRETIEKGLSHSKNQKINYLQKKQGSSVFIPSPEQINQTENTKQKRRIQHRSKFRGIAFLKEQGQARTKSRSLNWTPAEDRILFERYSEMGSRWVELSSHLPGKTDNDAKNRFYGRVKRVKHFLNEVQREQKLSKKSLISINSLLTVLEIDKRFNDVERNYSAILESRSMLIDVAQEPDDQAMGQQIVSLTRKLAGLKYCLKFLNSQRVKKNAQKKGKQLRLKLRREERLQREQRQRMMAEAARNYASLDIGSLCEELVPSTKSESKSLIEHFKDILPQSIVDRERNPQNFFT